MVEIKDLKKRVIVNNDANPCETTNEIALKVKNDLPLKSREEVSAFETQLLILEDYRREFVRIVNQVGGANAKEYTERVFNKIFAPSFAADNTWEGKKTKYKINELKLIKMCEVPEIHENAPTRLSIINQAATNNSSSQLLSSSQALDHLSKIYPKFPTNIQTVLRKGEYLKPRERTLIVHTARDYIIYDLKDLSLGTAGTISNQLVSKYQESFTTKIGCIDGEIQSLKQAVYSAVHYQKKRQAKDTCKISDSLDDNNDELVEKPKMQDDYGCVAYLPVSPSSEELQLMCRQRSELIDKYKLPGEEVTDEILTLMKKCYFLQRKEIHTEKDLLMTFKQWPFFHNYKLIIQHADELLGKNTNSMWKASLKKLAKPINRWAKNEEVAREGKDKNKRNAVDDERRYVRDRLKAATKYSDKIKNDEPYHTVVFEFIVKFMKEDLTFLYNLISEDIEDAELLEHVPVVNPVLMIRGQDLHHARNVYNVVINKEIVIHAESFSDGLLTTFLCYYVFGIVYPQEIEGTLEAIQRLFLQICPPKGTKRGGKRKATKIHPKVTKLTKEIDSYLADESTHYYPKPFSI